MILCSIGVTLLLIDGEVTRMNGTFLVLGVVAYTWHSIRNARQESNDIQAEFSEGVRDNRMHWGVEVGMVVVGLALLSVGGAILVQNGAAIAAILQVRPAIIALTVIAIGTSLPELATSMVASWRNQGDLAIGNVVGSNIFNLLAVIGISALVRPISHEGVEWTDMAFMIGTSVLLLPLVMTRKKLERWEGVLLIAIYIAYIVMVVKEDAIG